MPSEIKISHYYLKGASQEALIRFWQESQNLMDFGVIYKMLLGFKQKNITKKILNKLQFYMYFIEQFIFPKTIKYSII